MNADGINVLLGCAGHNMQLMLKQLRELLFRNISLLHFRWAFCRNPTLSAAECGLGALKTAQHRFDFQ